MGLSWQALQQFIGARGKDLRRIVSGTKGDVEIGDVQSEAFVIANEIHARRGHFDFENDEDQDTLLAGLWNRFVKFSEKHFRRAVKIDDDPGEDGESVGATVARSLRAVDTSDPAVLLEREQEASEQASKVADSYSEATAYVYLLRRFDEDKARLAVYLCVALYTLGARLRRAAETVKLQPSVFDGVERVPPDFQATIDRERTKPHRTELRGDQWTWGF